MKIICISASQIPSSTANSIQVMKACQALAQIGHQVHLLVPGQIPHPWDRLAEHYGLSTPFEVEWLPAQRQMRRYDFALRAVRRASSLGAQVVYVWPLQAAVMALLGKIPLLLELHGPPEGRFGPALFRQVLRLSGRKRLLPITQALRATLQARFPRQGSDLDWVIAPNGVDLERYQDLPDPPAARRMLDLPDGFTVGYTGHLYPGRGMRLIAALAKRHTDCHFLWVGGRPEEVDRWKSQLAQEGLTSIHLVGFVDNRHLPLYQAAADILLMPYETVISGSSGGDSADYCSPMKMFEYMASGRAILSSDLPVIHEVLDETSAMFCPPDDVDAWSTALARLSQNPDQRAALGANARQQAAVFTWQARARKCLAGFP